MKLLYVEKIKGFFLYEYDRDNSCKHTAMFTKS